MNDMIAAKKLLEAFHSHASEENDGKGAQLVSITLNRLCEAPEVNEDEKATVSTLKRTRTLIFLDGFYQQDGLDTYSAHAVFSLRS